MIAPTTPAQPAVEAKEATETESAVEAQDAIPAVYTLTNGDYYIYANEKLSSSDDTYAEIVSRKRGYDVSIGSESVHYAYRNELCISGVDNSDEISDEFTISHIHDLKIKQSTEKDAITAVCNAESSAETATLAEFNFDEHYYYGNCPSEENVKITEAYGLTVTCTDFYFTEKGKSTKLAAADMVVNKEYTVHATINVKSEDLDIDTDLAISKELTLEPRPFTECTFKIGSTTLEIQGDETDGYYVVAPENILTYNGKQQLPDITVTAGNTNKPLTKDTDFTIAAAEDDTATNAGEHTAVIKVKEGSTEYDNTPIEVKFSIAKAKNNMSISSVTRVYNGEKLNTNLKETSDFTCNDSQGILNEAGTVVKAEPCYHLINSADALNSGRINGNGIFKTPGTYTIDDIPTNGVFMYGAELDTLRGNGAAKLVGNKVTITEDGTLKARVLFEKLVTNEDNGIRDVEIKQTGGYWTIEKEKNNWNYDIKLNGYGLENSDLRTSGRQTVNFTIESPNYETRTIKVESTISKRNATVTNNTQAQSVEYGEGFELTYTLENANGDRGVLADEVSALENGLLTFDGNDGKKTHVGSYSTYTVNETNSTAKNYNWTLDNSNAGTVTITKRALKAEMFTVGDSYYNQENQTINLTAKDEVDGVNVLKSTDYKINCTAKKDAGTGYTATVTVPENSDYTLEGSLEYNWKIAPAVLSKVERVFGFLYYSDEFYLYIDTQDGQHITNAPAGVTVTYYKLNDGVNVPTNAEEFESYIADNSKCSVVTNDPNFLNSGVGKYIVKATANSGNYEGTVYNSFEVKKYPAEYVYEDNRTYTGFGKTYDGTAITTDNFKVEHKGDAGTSNLKVKDVQMYALNYADTTVAKDNVLKPGKTYTINGLTYGEDSYNSATSVKVDGGTLKVTSSDGEEQQISLPDGKSYWKVTGVNGNAITVDAVSLDGLAEITSAKNAGDYIATMKTNNPNYEEFTITKQFTIAKKEVTLTPTANQKTTYGVPFTGEVNYSTSGLVSDESLNANNILAVAKKTTSVQTGEATQEVTYDVTTIAPTPAPAGDYAYEVKSDANINPNYTVKIASGSKFTVEPKNISSDNTFVLTANSKEALTVYNGSEITVEPTFTYNDNNSLYKNIVADTDYAFTSDSVTKATKAGTYTVKVTGKGNYTGTKTATWTIDKAAMTSITVDPENVAYNAENDPQLSGIKVYGVNTKEDDPETTDVDETEYEQLTKDTDYTLKYFVIEPGNTPESITDEQFNEAVTNVKTPAVYVVIAEATAGSNYTGRVWTSFTITNATATSGNFDVTFNGGKDRIYDGTAIQQNATKQDFTVAAKANATKPEEESPTITKVEYYTVPANTDENTNLSAIAVDENKLESAPINAGNYVAKLTVKCTYTDEFTLYKAFEIKKKAVTVTLGHDDITWGNLVTYADVYTVSTENGFVTGGTTEPDFKDWFTVKKDDTVYDYSNGSNNAAGKYTIAAAPSETEGKTVVDDYNADATKNYTITVIEGTMTVKPYTLKDTDVTISTGTFDYDGSTKKPVLTVTAGYQIIDNETIKDSTDKYTLEVNGTKKKPAKDGYTSGDRAMDEAGEYTITVNGAGNFDGRVDKSWEIKAAEMKIELSESLDKTYDGNAVSVVPTVKSGETQMTDDQLEDAGVEVTYTYEKKSVEGESATWTALEEAPKDAGTYRVTVNAESSNYSPAAANKEFTISKATVTATLNEADLKKSSGYKDGTVRVTFSGLVESDNITLPETIDIGTDVENGTMINVDNVAFNAIKTTLGDNYTLVLDGTPTVTITVAKLEKVEVETSYIAENGGDFYVEPKLKGTDENGNEVTDLEIVSGRTETNKTGEYKLTVTDSNGTAKIKVVWKVELVESAVKFTENASSVVINPTNKALYVKVGYTANLVAEGFSVSEFGLIYNNKGNVNDVSELTLDAVDKDDTIVQKPGKNGLNIRDYGYGVMAVGYLKITDGTNTFVVYTSDIGGKAFVFTQHEPLGVINPTNNAEYVKIGFEGNVYDPNYTVKEYGLIYSNKGTITDASQLTIDAADGSTIVQKVGKNGLNVRDYGFGVIAVGYIKVTNTSNQEAIIYTNDLGGKYSKLTT